MPILQKIDETTEASELNGTLDILRRLHDILYPERLMRRPLDTNVTKQTVLKALFGDESISDAAGRKRIMVLLKQYHSDKLTEDHPLYNELLDCTQVLTQIAAAYNDLSTGPAEDLSSLTAAASAASRRPAPASAAAASRRPAPPDNEADRIIKKTTKVASGSTPGFFYSKSGLQMAAESTANEHAASEKFKLGRAHQASGPTNVNRELARKLLEDLASQAPENVFEESHVAARREDARAEITGFKSLFARTSLELRGIINDARFQIQAAKAEKASETASEQAEGDVELRRPTGRTLGGGPPR